jgi:sarcosine oxidase
MTEADVIVVGLGAYGAAVALQLQRRGLSVTGFDAHHPPHDLGSTHGETRITRLAIGEGDEYVPLAIRSHELWRQIEAETGERLMIQCGGLVLGDPSVGAALHGKADFVGLTIAAAERFGVAHQVLEARDVRARFPCFRPTDREMAYYEPQAGLLAPEACVAAQLRLAAGLGAELHPGERVLGIEPGPHGVRVTTDRGRYAAGRVVTAAGSWTPGLLGGDYRQRLTLRRQTLHWFAPEDPATYGSDRCPVFIWVHGAEAEDNFYGFPISPLGAGIGVKVANEQFAATVDAPEAVDRTVRPEESRAVFERHIAGRLAGLGSAPIRTATCIYPGAPHARFIIETHPDSDRVTVISACSGHGFKHSPAVGEAVAAWIATGDRPAVLAPFGPAFGRTDTVS